MLKTLYAKNFAIIDELKVNFHPGLNIITGETGAGKSILIGALGALLGERMNKEVIRSGADKLIIEGIFQIQNVPAVRDFLMENDLDSPDEELIIRREITINGRNRSFVNDSPVSLGLLSSLGDLLVDLHGQHDHQLLLKSAFHIQYLDEFAGLKEELSQYSQLFHDFLAAGKELKLLQERQEDIVKSRDVFSFQLQEINAVDPQPNEDEELEKEERILRNSELLYEKTTRLFSELYEKEGSVSEVLGQAISDLTTLAEIDENFSSFVTECENARITVDEIANALQKYFGEIPFDAERLEQIRERLAVLTGLKKKYGGTIDAVLQKKAQLEQELSRITNLDQELANLRQQVEEKRNELKKLSLLLSEKRRAAAEDLAEKAVRELAKLGMSKAKFQIRQEYKSAIHEPYIEVDGEKIQLNARGIDQIEFLISANPGEEPKPLQNVASGGEISRIMLALKSLLAHADKVPVLVFDEIDIGISGRIAQAVGRNLRKLAQFHQLISITHLPQIASMAHHHYLVEKQGDEYTTRTTIRELTNSERTEQIARLFGGERVTETHLQSATELMREAELFETSSE